MKTIKKAQTGVKQKPVAKPKGPRRTTSGMWVDEDKFRPPFDVEYADEVKPKAKTMPKKKAKNGTSLGMKSVKAGFDKNPGVTRADIIVAGKKEAKSGAKLKKQAAKAIAMKKAGKTPKAMMKSGGSMKKCRYGCK